MRKWGNGEMGKWGNEEMRKWGNEEEVRVGGRILGLCCSCKIVFL
jgi:hypothetical protein